MKIMKDNSQEDLFYLNFTYNSRFCNTANIYKSSIKFQNKIIYLYFKNCSKIGTLVELHTALY
jgi:transcription elongation factor Elf1